MNSSYGKVLTGGAVLILIASAVHAAPWDQSNQLTKMTKSYDTTRVETVTGVVETIFEKVPSSATGPDSIGFHLTLRTDREVIDVHLGPVWYLNGLDGTIDRGDRVQVTGSLREGRAPKDGKPAMRELRAAEVRKGNAVVLKLRDDSGKPLWSGF
jgi:hypothetical protein